MSSVDLETTHAARAAGYAVQEALSERVLPGGAAERVVRAARTSDGAPVVLRLVDRLADLGPELALLGRLHHPGLASILDAGTLSGGGGYVARAWIEGRDLGRSEALDARSAAGRIVQLAEALDVLHRSGFIHGDVKPANAILTDDGQVVLTDFGLARERSAGERADGEGGGTLGFAAPEVLAGHTPGPAADLFSLGVSLLELLGFELPPPSRLYARFPSEPFLAAAGIEPAQLPEELRDVVQRLLARDPAARPPTAADVARVVAQRVGLPRRVGDVVVAPPPWTHLAGRRDFVLERGAAARERGAREEWSAPSTEEARAVAHEATLALNLAGEPAEHVDLDVEAATLRDSVALDRWLARLAGRATSATLLVTGAGEPWAADLSRALAVFEHATHRGVVRITARGAGTPLPPQGGDALRLFVSRSLPGDNEETHGLLADSLEVEARGSSVAAAERFQALFRGGRVTDDGGGARLAPDVDARSVIQQLGRELHSGGPRRGGELQEDERALLAALYTLGGGYRASEADRAGRIAGVGELSSIEERLFGAGWIRIERRGGERTVVSNVGHGLLELGLSRAERRALHGRAADEFDDLESNVERAWPHRLLSGEAGGSERVLDEAIELRERGLGGRARVGLTRASEACTAEGVPFPLELSAERARCAAAAGDVQGALSFVKALGEAPAAQRFAAEVRARVASIRSQHAEAAQLFEAAGLEAEAGSERALAALNAGALADVEREVQRTLEVESVALPVRVNSASTAAIAALRRGEPEAVRRWLDVAEKAAAGADNPNHRATIALNGGTVLRRLGDSIAARMSFERAVAGYRELGLAPGLAQARLALSGLLREEGRALDAETLVGEALGTRRRLGDAPGAAAAQGMLGLARLERGHLRSALIDLESAARSLREIGRADQAELLEARAAEARARHSGDTPADEQIEAARRAAAGQGDPRVAIAVARALALSGGDGVAAAEALLDAISERASAMGRTVEAHEAAVLLGRASTPPGSGALRVLDLLRASDAEFDGRALFDEAEVLARNGIDDAAARAAIAVAARDVDPGRRARAAALARGLLERAASGDERADGTPTHSLLGWPDPEPTDLERWENDAEDEMDVMAVLGINERLVEQQDLDTLLGAIVDAAIEVTGAERGFLVLEEDGELKLDRALDSSRGDLDPDEVEYSESIVRAALERGGALRVADAGEDVLYGDARSVMSFEIRSVLGQPFDVGDGLRGVIVVDDRRRPGAFGPREERLLGLLAGQAALAIRQVRRLESITRLRDELADRVADRETRLEVVERRLEERGDVPPVEGLVGDSPPMQTLHKLLRKVAPSELAVLVTGESGTGKEVAARALHSLSGRAGGPFVAENCAALPATLLESELFGSRKGSFTGAERDREGLFERANGGTLFLDEIGELPLDQQAKLLRVLETREVRRVGDDVTRPVDFRLVAATNRDLAREASEGRFREDLMYRLDTVRVEMPPLRERVTDVPLLVEHFVRIAGTRDGIRRRVAPEVVRALCERSWPGNVRELANEISRLVVLSEGDLVDPTLVRAAPKRTLSERTADLVRPLEELEREAIFAALKRTDGDKRRAAELLGISRAKIYQRLKDWREED